MYDAVRIRYNRIKRISYYLYEILTTIGPYDFFAGNIILVLVHKFIANTYKHNSWHITNELRYLFEDDDKSIELVHVCIPN